MRPMTPEIVGRMQAAATDSMPDTVKIRRLERIYDSGGYHDEFIEIATSPCTIGLPLGGESDERNKSRVKIDDTLSHTVRMPAKVDVEMTDLLEVVGGDLDGSLWEVNAVMKRGAWEIARDVKVQAAASDG